MTVSEASAKSTMENEDKPRTVLIGNIPREVKKKEVEEVFGEIGPLRRCYIQYPRDDKKKKSLDKSTATLLCYVTYATPEDAVKAVERLGQSKLGGKKIYVKLAKNRGEQVRPPRDREVELTPAAETEKLGDGNDSRQVPKEQGQRQNPKKDNFVREKRKNPNLVPVGEGGEHELEEGPRRPKQPRFKPISKKSRLIVRNLSFKVTEEKMKEYFQSCGEVKEINILKKPDGKLVGCAFVQFDSVPQAAKAVRELNLKPFLGRPIAIDWALPKKDFQGQKPGGNDQEEIEVKDEKDDHVGDEPEEVTIKEEPEEVESEEDDDNVQFVSHYDEIKAEIKDEDGPNSKIKDEEESSDEDTDDDSEDEEDEDDVDPKKSRRSNDVEEGKTLFIRNLDFDVTEEQLKQFFEQYGMTHYSLLCKDPLTEHPKGTGFVKFKEFSDANKCLMDYNVSPSKFKLGNRLLNLSIALPKERVAQDNSKKEKMKQDNRNLFLVREGFIRPGSHAAMGVSVSDMNKRAALNSTKKQLLKNLSIFVSPTRLCIHNLPVKITDKALRKLFKKYSPPGARITEARIMRDMKDIQLGGKGMSKGYGFISFAEHEHALAALRATNNNPEIFTPNQRPIVEFSLENRKALQAKQKRLQKSVEKNTVKPKPKTQRTKEPQKGNSPANNNNLKKGKPQRTTTDAEEIPFAGLTGKPGVSKIPAMKAKGKPGKITRNSLRGNRTMKGNRAQKRKLQERKVRETQIRPKRSIDKPDKAENIVSNYKRKLDKASSVPAKKGKWYQ